MDCRDNRRILGIIKALDIEELKINLKTGFEAVADSVGWSIGKELPEEEKQSLLENLAIGQYAMQQMILAFNFSTEKVESEILKLIEADETKLKEAADGKRNN